IPRGVSFTARHVGQVFTGTIRWLWHSASALGHTALTSSVAIFREPRLVTSIGFEAPAFTGCPWPFRIGWGRFIFTHLGWSAAAAVGACARYAAAAGRVTVFRKPGLFTCACFGFPFFARRVRPGHIVRWLLVHAGF